MVEHQMSPAETAMYRSLSNYPIESIFYRAPPNAVLDFIADTRRWTELDLRWNNHKAIRSVGRNGELSCGKWMFDRFQELDSRDAMVYVAESVLSGKLTNATYASERFKLDKRDLMGNETTQMTLGMDACNDDTVPDEKIWCFNNMQLTPTTRVADMTSDATRWFFCKFGATKAEAMWITVKCVIHGNHQNAKILTDHFSLGPDDLTKYLQRVVIKGVTIAVSRRMHECVGWFVFQFGFCNLDECEGISDEDKTIIDTIAMKHRPRLVKRARRSDDSD